MNRTAAAIPLIVAFLGTAGLGPDGAGLETRVRIAANAQPDLVAEAFLTEDQQSWLDQHNPWGIPVTQNVIHKTLVVREGYTLAHNNVDLIADWVSFHSTREYVQGTEKRPGSSAFKPDPTLSAGQRAELKDYKGWKGVYDRGHQVASGDSKGRGKRIIRESFFLSNMTPQSSRLNQHRWRLLEAHIQGLADDREEVWVVTGPVFLDDDGDGLVEYFVIGDNRVAVPTHYFKIVVAESEDGSEIEAMAFLIPNREISEPFDDFLVSIDELESFTGYNFFPRMADAEQDDLEAVAAEALWPLEEG